MVRVEPSAALLKAPCTEPAWISTSAAPGLPVPVTDRVAPPRLTAPLTTIPFALLPANAAS